jgi:hypothetical protein
MENMETQLLREAEVYPSMAVISQALGKSFGLFEEYIQTVTGEKYHLEPKWNFYKDGKAWLCKVCKKSRTVCWLSIWDTGFKISFFFTSKTISGVAALDISQKIKNELKDLKPIGKLVPLIIRVEKKKQIKDVLTIMDYKISLK